MEQPSGTFSALDEFERRFVKPTQGRALIVGSRVYDGKPDRRMHHADALGVDMLEGLGVDRVLDLEEDLPEDLGTFAHVDCMSVLEHSRRPWLLAANLDRLLEQGGTLFVSTPFVWRVHAYPSDYWRFTLDGLRQLFPSIAWVEMMYVHTGMTRKNKIPVRTRRGHPFFARTEACGFGVKR